MPTERSAGAARATVIGGGVAGLATAILLARAGARVDLLEKNNQLGGRAGILSADGFTFDTGPSWYLMPEVFDHFFALAGTSTTRELDLVDLDPGYRVFDQAGRHTLDVPHPGNGADSREAASGIVDVFEALEPGSGPALRRYLDSASDTYRLALDRFLYTNFDSAAPVASTAVARRLPTLPGLLAGSMEKRIARTVRHPLLRQILGYPAVFLGMSPATAPALYHLMSHLDLADGVRYPMGGMHTLVDALERLARAAGVRVHLGAEAVAITERRRLFGGPGDRARTGVGRRLPRGAGWAAESVTVRSQSGGIDRIPADIVVSAGDKHHFDTHLLPKWARSETERAWAHKDPGIGAFVIMLGVRGRLPQLAHHNLFFTDDWQANFQAIFTDGRLADPASTYVCAPSRTDPSVAPPDCENLFILVPAPADPNLRAGQHAIEEYAETIIDAVGTRIGVTDLRQRILKQTVWAPGDYVRLYHAWHATALGPANTLMQSAMFRGATRNPHLDNVFYAGTFAAPGVGLPLALISAQNVAKAIAGDRSAGPPGPDLVDRLGFVRNHGENQTQPSQSMGVETNQSTRVETSRSTQLENGDFGPSEGTA